MAKQMPNRRIKEKLTENGRFKLKANYFMAEKAPSVCLISTLIHTNTDAAHLSVLDP